MPLDLRHHPPLPVPCVFPGAAGGWRPSSVFARYNITSERHLAVRPRARERLRRPPGVGPPATSPTPRLGVLGLPTAHRHEQLAPAHWPLSSVPLPARHPLVCKAPHYPSTESLDGAT